MPLLYEEKEFIHQEEIMYTVFILGLRKRNLNLSPTRSLILGKHCSMRQKGFDVPPIVVTGLSSLKKDMSEFLRIDALLT